jgi:predicted secreted protein
MTLPMGIAVYFTMWWVVLFAVLPFGVHSQKEDGSYFEGTDPGAPVRPLMLLKLLWTTVISAILFTGLLFYMNYSS